MGEIDQYCRKNNVDSRLTYRIQLCFEEIIQQILMKNLKNPLIDVIVEYSDAEDKVYMIMRFNGPKPDESNINNELSYAMLKSIISEFTYECTEEEDYPNKLTFEIDNKRVFQ